MADPFTKGQLSSGGQMITDGAGIWQPLYDRLQVTAAGGALTLLSFFTLGFTAGRTEEDTNVPEGGVLSGGQTFSIQGLSVGMIPRAGNVPNIQDFYRCGEGLVRVNTNQSTKYQAHVLSLGGTFGASGQASAAAAGQVNWVNGSASRVDVMMFPRQDFFIPIISEGQLSVEITWPVAFPWTPTTTYLIFVYLHGELVKTIDR